MLNMNKIILWFFLAAQAFAIDTSSVYQCEAIKVYGPENTSSSLNVGLCVCSGKQSSYFLVSKYYVLDEVNFKTNNGPSLAGILYNQNEEYQLALYKTFSVKEPPAKFNDPKPNEPLTIIIQRFNTDNTHTFQQIENVKLDNLKTIKGEHAEDISTIEVQYLSSQLPFGGGVIYNNANEVVGLLVHVFNRDKKVYVSGPSGKTIATYLRSVKYDYACPEAPREKTSKSSILVNPQHPLSRD